MEPIDGDENRRSSCHDMPLLMGHCVLCKQPQVDAAQNPSPVTENKDLVSAGQDPATVPTEELNQVDQSQEDQNSSNEAQNSSGVTDGSPRPAPQRHPLAIAWDEWLASEEGQSCCNYASLTGEHYLENRLNRAFQAGVKAAEAHNAPADKGDSRT